MVSWSEILVKKWIYIKATHIKTTASVAQNFLANEKESLIMSSITANYLSMGTKTLQFYTRAFLLLTMQA